jgi:hypothetical protein
MINMKKVNYDSFCVSYNIIFFQITSSWAPLLNGCKSSLGQFEQRSEMKWNLRKESTPPFFSPMSQAEFGAGPPQPIARPRVCKDPLTRASSQKGGQRQRPTSFPRNLTDYRVTLKFGNRTGNRNHSNAYKMDFVIFMVTVMALKALLGVSGGNKTDLVKEC